MHQIGHVAQGVKVAPGRAQLSLAQRSAGRLKQMRLGRTLVEKTCSAYSCDALLPAGEK